MLDRITKNNPHGSPLLGQRVHVKDYTTNVMADSSTQPTTQRTAENMPPPPPEENTQQTNIQEDNNNIQQEEKVNHQQAEQKEGNFGNDYAGDNIDDYSKINEEQGGAGIEGEEQAGTTTQIPSSQTKLMSKVIVSNIQNLAPSLFVGLSTKVSGIKERDLDLYVATDKIDKRFVDLYHKDKLQLKKDLEITDEEARLLEETLDAYLQYQNIQTANPANAFFLQAGLITLRLTITSIQHGAQQRKHWADALRQHAEQKDYQSRINKDGEEPK